MVLSILNFISSKKLRLKEYYNITKDIKKTKVPKFAFDGNYLKEKGMKEGVLIGKTLKLIENEWLDNNFKLSDKKISKIIEEQSR